MEETEAKLREKFSLKFAIEIYGNPHSKELAIRTIVDPEVKPGAENQWVDTAAAAVAQELKQYLAHMMAREASLHQSIAQGKPIAPGPNVFESLN